MKLYHIPNLVLGLKLRNKPVNFIVGHISILYIPNDVESFQINNSSVEEYIRSMVDGAIFIEKLDTNFKIYDELSNFDFKCMAYTYGDIDTHEDEMEIDYIVSRLETIFKENLESIFGERVEIADVTIKY